MQKISRKTSSRPRFVFKKASYEVKEDGINKLHKTLD